MFNSLKASINKFNFLHIALIICVVFVLGCGLRSDDKTQSKQTQKVDYVSLAMGQLAQKDLAGAFKNFDNAIKQEPNNLTNYVVLSQVYAKLQQFDRAVDTLSVALKIDPQNGEIYYLVAQSLAKQEGKKDEAILATKRSVEMFIADRNEPGLLKATSFLQSLGNSDLQNLPE